jgi:3-oxoadipate enol-lactonase
MIPFHRIDGPDDAPVLVLSNSLGTTLEMWDPQVPELGKHFRVVRYDRRGHGRSAVPPGPYTAGDFGHDLLELLDSLEIERVSLCGLSMGGMVGIWLGVNAPERVDRLALSCTAARFGTPEIWIERAAAVREAASAEVLADGAMERWFSPGFREAHPETVARFREMVASTPAEGYAGCCDALRDFDYRERLGEIEAPTVVVSAALDPATPPGDGELIAAGIPGARLVVIDDTAHLANVEQPETYTRTILDHLLAGA